MAITIYHNPRCSKSRKALELLQDRGITPTVIEYLKTPPGAETVLTLAGLLDLPVTDLLRTGEAEFREATDLPALDDGPALAAWIALHPRTLQRPIIVAADGRRAVIGRPPENVTALLEQ